jgi:toxin ParE1/3/4
MMRPRFSPTARRDLRQILDYITQDKPIAAAEWVAKIEERCWQLAQFPYTGTACPDLLPNLRCASVGAYVIFFLPQNDGIKVVRVVHGARDVNRLFRK